MQEPLTVGKLYKDNRKVFKLKRLKLKAGEMVRIQKNHRFLKNATTFTHYPGAHRITLQINGQCYGNCDFELTGK